MKRYAIPARDYFFDFFLAAFFAVFFAAGLFIVFFAFLADFFADFLAAFLVAMSNSFRSALGLEKENPPHGASRQSGYSSAHADALSPRHPQKCVWSAYPS